MRPRRALAALSCLASCGAPPPPPAAPPAPDLAALVAPGPVRPELRAPLTALLRGDLSDMLLPLGDDTVRCSVELTTRRAQATCEGVSVRAVDVPSLVRKLHAGEPMVDVLWGRLDDEGTFRERTGFKGLAPGGGPWTARAGLYLEEPLGLVRFSVGERGEVVEARFAGLEGEETLAARSLVALGQRLRERQAALGRVRATRAARAAEREGFASMLASLRPASTGGWELIGLTVGQPAREQAALRGALEFERSTPAGTWPRRWRSFGLGIPTIETDLATGAPLTPLPREQREATSLDGVLVVVHLSTRLDATEPPAAPLDCAAHDAWMASHPWPFAPHPAPESPGCQWRASRGDSVVILELIPGQAQVSLVWQLDRYTEQARQAEEEVVRRRRAEVCARCASPASARGQARPYVIERVDRARCQMLVRPLRGTFEPGWVDCE